MAIEKSSDKQLVLRMRLLTKVIFAVWATGIGLAFMFRYGDYALLDWIVFAVYPPFLLIACSIAPGMIYVMNNDGITINRNITLFGFVMIRIKPYSISWNDIDWVQESPGSSFPPKLFSIRARGGSRGRLIMINGMMTNLEDAMCLIYARVPSHRIDEGVKRYVSSLSCGGAR